MHMIVIIMRMTCTHYARVQHTSLFFPQRFGQKCALYVAKYGICQTLLLRASCALIECSQLPNETVTLYVLGTWLVAL